MEDLKTRKQQALQFLKALFGDAVSKDALILIWPKPSGRGHFFDHPAEAADFAIRACCEGKAVYVGCGLYRRGIRTGRGKADDVVCIPALWADIDVGKDGCFPNDERAMKWLARIEPQVTLVVHSGWGLHAYWMLRSPLRVDTDKAKTLPQRWIKHLQSRAAKLGVKLDQVGDLARVLRVPGTENRKRAESAPVLLIEANNRRYEPQDFEAKMPSLQTQRRTRPSQASGRGFHRLKYAVGQLSDQRATEYGDWLTVGMAIHSAFSDERGLNLWDEFSRRTTRANYSQEACREKWRSFSQDGGVTVATIYKMAEEDAMGQRSPDDPHRLASAVLDRYFRHEGMLTLRFYHGGWWVWEDCHYRHLDPKEIRARVNKYVRQTLNGLGSTTKVGQFLVSNVLGAMEGSCLVPDTIDLPAWIGETPRPESGDLLPMENGLLNLEAALRGDDDPMLEHTPDWFSPTRWPYRYDPEAKRPQWWRFLQRVLPGQAERLLLQEFLGYCLMSSTQYQKFLILVGEGANGKSVITEVATHLLGPDNVTHVGIEDFGERFALARTIGKLANIVSEIGPVRGVAEDKLKAIVTGDRIRVEFKHQTPFDAKPTTRLIFATNEVPTFSDRTGGLWRRLLILPFTVTIPEREQDPHLAARICKAELPGIFNWALRGLKRLRARGKFKVPPSAREAIRAHRRESNPARDFLETECVESPEEEIGSAGLYERYRRWCAERQLIPLAEQQLGREVRRVFPSIKRIQRHEKGRRPYYYSGLTYQWGKGKFVRR